LTGERGKGLEAVGERGTGGVVRMWPVVAMMRLVPVRTGAMRQWSTDIDHLADDFGKIKE